jgi:endonuclease/exonuclease/phosphatase family metal-dependent hydrolase
LSAAIVAVGLGCRSPVGHAANAVGPGVSFAVIPSQGSPTALDIGNWNLEWFGHTGFGPTNEALQLQNVGDVMRGADMDIWGVEEVVSAPQFQQLVAGLPGYAGILANDPFVVDGATYYNGFGNTEQKVALVYPTSVVSVLSAKVILGNLDFEFAGRPPVEFKVRITLNGVTRDASIIVLHAKAGSDADSYNRRAAASAGLKNYLDTTYPNEQVWVIGDFNDDVDVSITTGNATPYGNFVNDGARYSFPTKTLSDAGQASTVTFADMIDHQLNTNEVFATYTTGSAQVFRADRYIANYGTTTSDHYPVLARYTVTGSAPAPANVIINEIFANEPGSATAGEAVELVNVGETTADLSGWTVSDAAQVRHTFAQGTTLAPGKAIAVYGGASAIPAGINAVAASTGALSLNNAGDAVVVKNAAGTVVDQFSYTSALSGTDGVSMNRSPDTSPTGTFVLHTKLSTLQSSIGKRVNGSAF